MTRDQRDISGALTPAGASEWTVSNRTVDRTHNCNEVTGAADIAYGDVLGTLIEDLIAQGILKGSVS